MGRFTELETFVRVVESASFSAAAERLQVTKSVVSRRISELEERLGVRLLQRTTRRLSLTEAGRQLYERAVRLLLEMDEAEQALTSGLGALRGRLRVAAPHSFGILHLGPAIEEFLARHPEVELELDLNDRLVNLVEEGFDMALRIGRLTDSSLVARRLAPIRLVALASPGYLAQYGEPKTPRDLMTHQGLIYTNAPDPQVWHFLDGEGKRHAVRIPARLRANNGDVLLGAAQRDLGVLLSPTFIAWRAIESGALRPILPGYTLEESAAYAVFPSNRHLPARVRAFIEVLAQRFGDAPYWDRCLEPPQ